MSRDFCPAREDEPEGRAIPCRCTISPERPLCSDARHCRLEPRETDDMQDEETEE